MSGNPKWGTPNGQNTSWRQPKPGEWHGREDPDETSRGMTVKRNWWGKEEKFDASGRKINDPKDVKDDKRRGTVWW